MSPHDPLLASLLVRLRQVRLLLGQEPGLDGRDTCFADALDSMGFAEFLALVADDCGVPIEAIERATGRRYGTVAELATSLQAAGLRIGEAKAEAHAVRADPTIAIRAKAWLAATVTRLPRRVQPAFELNGLLQRPPSWLQEHAGIQARHVWDDEDALDAAAGAPTECLANAGLSTGDVGALLVTSEAPPLLGGLAAVLHQHLRLPTDVSALDIGGACTGFLAALWTAQHLAADRLVVLVLSVEAPSRWFAVRPGNAGETAALFGDALAACVLSARPMHHAAMPLRDIRLGTDGAASSLLQIHCNAEDGIALHMEGVPLAQRAVRAMAEAVVQICEPNGLTIVQLAAVVAHGGNGRMPALLARRLGLPAARVWSESSHTGNLGSASLPIAFAARGSSSRDPVVWTAAGAGMQWGVALFGSRESPGY